MKISHVKISNILGIDELEFSPGGFTAIKGANGTGKTSVLEAIKAAVAPSGHDATLLRNGAEEGEIVLVLDDGTEISKRVGERSSPLNVYQDGKKVSRPAELLKSITDLLSVNPVEFLNASKKDRARVLLEAMPLVADCERLTNISGIKASAQEGVHALAVIDAVRKQVYDDRTGTNRAIKEKTATINQVRLAMPEAPAGADGSEEALQADITAATAARDAELERIAHKLGAIKHDKADQIERIKAEAQERIDAIRAEAQANIDAIRNELADTEVKASTQRERAINKYNETVAPIQSALGAIRTNRAAIAKREQAESTIAQMETELEELKHDEERQTTALEGIDEYKLELLQSLPIPGLEVIDGEVYRDGVVFERLNTAQKVDIAVQVAKLRAGQLGIVCVDGIECLDASAFEEFKGRALQSGLQLFVSRVSHDSNPGFSVETEQ